jgi:two-component sensor histidine kinase
MPITNMLGVAVMGYSILSRQVFNPLKDHNMSLQKEILTRISTEDTLKSSLKEKEILLREVHHRVKNNLQVISSLLNLQVSHIRDPESAEAFKESQGRIRSMSLVHELLYKTRDFQKTDFNGYLKALLTDLFRSYGISPERIRHEIRVRDVPMQIGKAIPCGLVINELISNALKYAFPSSFKGKPRLTVAMRMLETGKIELVVQDNGVGLPAGFDVRKSESLGLQLVSMLVEDQLKGGLEIKSRAGVKIRITFAV